MSLNTRFSAVLFGRRTAPQSLPRKRTLAKDTPPANICSDARRVSTVTGYSVIVARRDLSYVEDIKILAGQLLADRAQVVGTVLNEA